MTFSSRCTVPRQWLPFLGPKLGIAKVLYSLATDPDDFDIHNVFPTVTSLGRLLGHEQPLSPHAGGAGIRLEEATNRAMGELVERYAFFAYDGSGAIVASFNELIEQGHRPVPLESLTYFSLEQHRSKTFPYAKFTETTRVVWLKGTHLLDGLTSYVPDQLVSLGNSDSPIEMVPLFYPTSSGCAVATSMEEALFNGLLETIERDAIMIRWYARLPPPILDIDPLDLLPGRPLALHGGLEIRVHDLTVDGDIPVAGVTCIERTGRPCFFILGAGAALDIWTAARKALLEVGQGRPFIKYLVKRSEAPGEDALFSDFESNLRFYAEPSNARYVEWFLQNSKLSARTFSPMPEAKNPRHNLMDLLDRCESMALTPIAFDMTTQEMLDIGLFACKVFVPELVPLCVPSAPFLAHPRLVQFNRSPNLESGSMDIPDWIPHPFP
jgi:ribosomal protein S12 methylthiotransferase accessory factor